jgi:hypothetical protein
MTKAQIKEIQKTIGAEVDGIWGKESTEKCRLYLRKLMPKPNPWPKTAQADLSKFYGPPCDEDQLVAMPAPVPMYFEGKLVKTLRCHNKLVDSLGRALTAAYEDIPEVIQIYDGIYNCRKMTGGKSPSLHARGAAIDIWAAKNGMKVPWPTKALMPFAYMEHFAREGWLTGGAFWGYDSMHAQATQ